VAPAESQPSQGMSGKRHTWAKRARWASALFLWVYVVSLGWVMPLGTATVAMLDDDHRVQLAVGSEGARVVLVHDASDPAKSPWHEHCAVSATLVALSPSAAGTSDHVLSFPFGVTIDRTCAVVTPSEVPSGPEWVWVSWTVPGCAMQRMTVVPPRKVLTPTSCAVVRTTVLLC